LIKDIDKKFPVHLVTVPANCMRLIRLQISFSWWMNSLPLTQI